MVFFNCLGCDLKLQYMRYQLSRMGEGLVTGGFLSSQTKLSPGVAIMSGKVERGDIFCLRRKKKENSWVQDGFTDNTNLISKGGDGGYYNALRWGKDC